MVGQVYFARCEGGPVKIGFTINVAARLAALQTSSAAPICLLAQCEGDRKTEAFFHRLVAHHRLYGEWFRPDPTVLHLVSQVDRGEINVPPQYLPTPADRATVGKSNKRSRDIIESARQWIQEIAAPVPFGERMEKTLRRVSSTACVSYRAVKAIWYGETETMKAEVYVGLQEAFDRKMSQLAGGVQ